MTTDTNGKGGKKGKKGEEVEQPQIQLKPVFDYGDDKFNAISEEIWDVREKLNQKTLEKNMPDDKSTRSKKKKGKR